MSYTLSEAWSRVNWADLMGINRYYDYSAYDRNVTTILRCSASNQLYFIFQVTQNLVTSRILFELALRLLRVMTSQISLNVK